MFDLDCVARYLAWTVPVGPTAGRSSRHAVGTTAETISLAAYRGYRIAIVADAQIGVAFGGGSQLPPDPTLSSGDQQSPGGDLRGHTYMEHAVVQGETDVLRVIAAAASTSVSIYVISRPASWWRERLR